MSGIAGLFRFDGQAVARRDLEQVANALRPYGPDRADMFIAGSVGLVHVLMLMTPEDQFDRQPWQGAGGAVITADLRIDNRDEVLARIGVASEEAMSWADSRVLLRAWEEFGDSIWPTLRGPFAAAIWDPCRRALTLARDHFGQSVVMWHKTSRFFAFATMPKGLFALPDVPHELNEEKFADFLVLNHDEQATTVYRNIFRILPAHVASVKADGSMVQHRYWSAAEVRAVRLPSDQAYAEGLRECLDRAVRRQMRSAYPIGCFLSGGLDSSSVAALAANALSNKNQRLAAFTQVPREGFDGKDPIGRFSDETPYVEAIRNKIGNIDVTYIRNNECEDFTDLERLFVALEGPVRNPTTLGWMLAIFRLAQTQDRRVLLGGAQGNFTISWVGWSQAADHLLRGRLLTAYRQWRQFYRMYGGSRLEAFIRLFVEPLLPDKLGRWSYPSASPRIEPWKEHSAIHPDFAAAMGVAARASLIGHDFLYRVRPGERLKSLAPVDYAGDSLAAYKAFAGVEVRDPTADVDVVSYCLGIPPEQYLAEDIDRSLIRRAMWGLLPEVVLTNRRVGLQSADWYEKLEGRRDRLAAEIAELSALPLVRRAIDVGRLNRAVQNWPTGDWHTRRIYSEYGLVFPRGLAAARFLRWVDQAKRSS
jgi:asparagine synthase (glutamine-hydrolysing)